MSEIPSQDPNDTVDPFDPATGGRSVEADSLPPCQPTTKRKQAASAYRRNQAEIACRRDPEPEKNRNNGEEWELRDPTTGVPTYAANSTKGMPHDEIGEVIARRRVFIPGPNEPVPFPNEETALEGDLSKQTFTEKQGSLESTDGGPQPTTIDPAEEQRRFTAYDALRLAVNTENPADFARIPIGPNLAPRQPIVPTRPFVDPQNGIAFDLEGPDAPSGATYRGQFRADGTPIPERILLAPRFQEAELAADVGEVYLMALLRDVPVRELQGTSSQNADVQRAVRLMNQFTGYRGPVDATTGQVTAGTIFRGGNVRAELGKGSQNVGELDGPYLSQFMIIGSRVDNSFPPQRSPGTAGKTEAGTAARGVHLSRADGQVLYGTLTIDQRQFEVQPGLDFVTDYDVWLQILQGVFPADLERQVGPTDPNDQASQYTGNRTFRHTLRQMAEYVHRDQTFQEGLIAALLIISMNERAERTNQQLFNDGNAYLRVDNQTGFGSFGNGHVLALLSEATTRAIKAAWYQKWFNHRRVRPEVLAGRIHNVLREKVKPSRYNINEEITGLPREIVGPGPGAEISLETAPGAELMAWVAEHNKEQNVQNHRPTDVSYLLPQQYPEGSPTHPSYPAGHATQIAAEVTVLKGLFNEGFRITDPLSDDQSGDRALVPSADGSKLELYEGMDANVPLTLGRELNKLAANVSLARSLAGVHYRLDYSESALLGEYVGLGILQEQAQSFNNADFFFELTLFSGIRVRVLSDGRIVRA